MMARIIDHPLSRSECSFWIVAPGTVMMMEGPIGFASCSSIPTVRRKVATAARM